MLPVNVRSPALGSGDAGGAGAADVCAEAEPANIRMNAAVASEKFFITLHLRKGHVEYLTRGKRSASACRRRRDPVKPFRLSALDARVGRAGARARHRQERRECRSVSD